MFKNYTTHIWPMNIISSDYDVCVKYNLNNQNLQTLKYSPMLLIRITYKLRDD